MNAMNRFNSTTERPGTTRSCVEGDVSRLSLAEPTERNSIIARGSAKDRDGKQPHELLLIQR